MNQTTNREISGLSANPLQADAEKGQARMACPLDGALAAY